MDQLPNASGVAECEGQVDDVDSVDVDAVDAMGVSKNNGKTPQIIHENIGFGTITHYKLTIHFGVPLFLETPIYLYTLLISNSHESFTNHLFSRCFSACLYHRITAVKDLADHIARGPRS